MTDNGSSEFRLRSTWRSFGGSLAAGIGALTALVSLVIGAPLAGACGRGALALIGVTLVTRITGAALAGTCRIPSTAEGQTQPAPEE